MSLEGRVALVTGGNRGIGKGIALALAQDGATLAVNYRGDEDSAKETVAEIEALGVPVKAYQASVDDYEGVAAMIAQIVEDFGTLDIVVNNAGIASRGRSVADTDPDEMRRVVGVHFFGTYYVTHEAIPHLRGKDRADIIMITSSATRDMMPYGAPYSVGKMGQEALAWTVDKEERANKIRVNIVSPGVVDTDMGRRLVKARGVDDIRDSDATSPWGRVCQPEDVGNVVRWLVSGNNSYVTGERIYVDGFKGVD